MRPRWFVLALAICGSVLCAQAQSAPGYGNDPYSARIVSTPEIALPGSGAPVGSGIVDVNVNNAAQGGTGMIYDPNVVGMYEAEGTAEALPQAPRQHRSLSLGMQNFQSGLANSTTTSSTVTLSDVAHYYKQRRTQDNPRVLTLPSTAPPTSDAQQPSTPPTTTAPQQD
jgi:hypothetical protein